MTGLQILLCAFLVFSFLIVLVVLGDVLRYRDLQRRLREKLNETEADPSRN